MSNYNSLKATINANIKTNGNQEITGSVLNSVLNAMVNTLGAGYQYAGVATPSSNPGTPDTNVFYIAAIAGTYTNMGGLVVSDGEAAILKYNGTWTKDVTGVATTEQISQLGQELGHTAELEFILNKYINLSGGVGSVVPAPVDSQSFSYCKHEVTEGDIVIVNGTGGVSPKLWAFADDNDIILSVADSSITGVNLQLVAPQNASYVIINTNDTSTPSYYEYHNSIASRLEENENSIFSLNERVDDLDQELHQSSQVPISLADTLQGKFISSAGNATDFSSYDILIYELAGISKVRISISGAASGLHLYGFYSSQTISSANLVGVLGPTTSDGLYDQEVDVPSGAEYLAITSYRGFQTTQIYSIVATDILQEIEQQISELDNSKQEKLTSGENIKTLGGESILGSGDISAGAKNFNYLFVTGGIIIARPSGNRMMTIRLGAGGGNGLFDFREFGTLPLGSEIIEANIQRLHYSSSDWIAPFQIKAVNNIDGDDLDNITFTGGSHQYNNQISGSTPTARLDSVEYRIDGEIKTEGGGYGNAIKIVATEYIQGTNTKKADGTGREILKEIVTWSYDGDKWGVETELVPLEDIQMILWYGYQFTGIGSGLFEHWGYINGANRSTDAATSGNDKTIGMYAFGNCNLKMLVDTITDMGNRAFMTSGATNSAFKSGAKGYFFIANNNAILGQNNHYFLNGSYKIGLPKGDIPVKSGSFHTSGDTISQSIPVSELEDGNYYVIWRASGSVTPNACNIYRTERNTSGLIQPLYTNILPGQRCDIEKTAATNYLWFYKNGLSSSTDATIAYEIF